MAAGLADHGIVHRSELYLGDILKPEHGAVGQSPDYKVFIFRSILISPAVFQHILKGVHRLRAQSARGRLKILLGKHLVDIGRYQPVLRHLGRVEPDSHRIFRAEDIHLTHARYSRQPGLDVDFHVVGEKFRIVGVVRAIEGDRFQGAVLALAHRHAAFCHLGRQKTLGRSHTVLHVHHSHIGISPLPEIDGNGGHSGVGGRGGHIHHVFHAVERLLERHHHALHHRLRVGACI